jgi:hypothetical protein
MRSLILTITAAFALLFSAGGCKDAIFYPDVTPPAPPRGITTSTGDGLVEIFWLRNTEPDVYGYNVYASSSATGTYELIGSSRTPYFLDNGVTNGRTYYYAVTAYDNSGNESDVSSDVAYDTPRPEGIDVPLYNYRTNALLAGYDFSTYSVGPYNDPYTDVFFENDSGAYYLNVWQDSDIQDMGYTRSLYDIGYAPESGWAPTKDAPVILGHTYVIWTYDNHFAKLRVTQVSGTKVTFDWAYQLQQGNPRLKPGAERGSLVLGAGAASRQ